ncbi:HAUS augmin-like complex subunit 4 [Aix galericulata]|nr:HAUS augmin-like complex subunit 4 [Aix galericulata]
MTDLEAELLGPALPLPPPEELLPYPGLGQLLAALGAGPEGAGPEGAGPGAARGRSLRRAEAELGRQRAAWLAREGLWRAVLELLREPRPQEAPPTLELALALAELRLGPPLLAALLPPPQDPAPLRLRLLPLVERRLAGKVGQLADYVRGRGRDVAAGGDDVSDDVSDDVTKAAKELAAQRRRLEAATARRRRLAGQLESLHRLYPQALGRCGALLGRLQEARAEGAELERHRGLYLEAKGAATLLKIRLEELTLLLDTYSPAVLEAHRVIRSRLEAALSQAEGELSGTRKALEALQALGPGFQEAAAEYGRLRERLRHRRWALRQLHGCDGDVTDDVSDDVTKDGGPA